MCPSIASSSSDQCIQIICSHKISQIQPLNFSLKVHQIHAFHFKKVKKNLPGGHTPGPPQEGRNLGCLTFSHSCTVEALAENTGCVNNIQQRSIVSAALTLERGPLIIFRLGPPEGLGRLWPDANGRPYPKDSYSTHPIRYNTDFILFYCNYFRVYIDKLNYLLNCNTYSFFCWPKQ